MKKWIFSIFIFLIFIPAGIVSGQKRIYPAKEIYPHPPIIDGTGDEPVWSKAEWSGDFTQMEPLEKTAPSENTAFKILYDDKFIYMFIRADDSSPVLIDRRMARRDDCESDNVQVIFDSYHDFRTGFKFIVTAAGIKGDAVLSNDGEAEDPNWNPAWEVKTATSSQGWTAEMKIPLNQLKFSKSAEQKWGLQVIRNINRKNEVLYWQYIPKTETGFVSHFGELHGIETVSVTRGIELLPYALAKRNRYKPENGNPFATGSEHGLVSGLDGKIEVTGDLNLDFTINPDFGQVEADPSELNLTGFETYFDERRPFFVESADIYDFQITKYGSMYYDNLFYSRRIGCFPRYTPELNDNEYMDIPLSNTILGAFKLSGRIEKGVSIGIMETVTQKEQASISSGNKVWKETVEPLTNYFVGRIQKDYDRGNSVLGGIFTAVNRDIHETNLNFLSRSAYSGGINIKRFFNNKKYYVLFNSIISRIGGSRKSILEAQTAVQRYFQRPDARHISVDSSKTSLSGHGGTVEIGKSSGKIQYMANFSWRSPGLELNDIGYLQKADAEKSFLRLKLSNWNLKGFIKEYSLYTHQWNNWDFSGLLLNSGGNIFSEITFRNNWSIATGIARDNETLMQNELRGGPMLKWPGTVNISARLRSDNSKTFRFITAWFGIRNDEKWENMDRYRLEFAYRPVNAFEFSAEPEFSIYKSKMKYVGQEKYNDDIRYLTASLKRKTFSLTLRMNYCFTPDLTVQFYGQPYISTGSYADFKYITASRADNAGQRYHQFSRNEIEYRETDESYEIDENRDGAPDYTISNPDFNFSQLNTNLVIRWEYSPGSTLFLVWSQGRSFSNSFGEFNFSRNISNLFEIYPQNIFLIKLNRRISF